MTTYALLVSWADDVHSRQVDIPDGQMVDVHLGRFSLGDSDSYDDCIVLRPNDAASVPELYRDVSGVEALNEHGVAIARVFCHGTVKPRWLVAKRTQTIYGPEGLMSVNTLAALEHELAPELKRDTEPELDHEPELVSLLALADASDCPETDRRRIHALADYVTAHTSLCQVVADEMTLPECWCEPGVIDRLVDRARNLLTALQANATYLTSTAPVSVDLTMAPNVMMRA